MENLGTLNNQYTLLKVKRMEPYRVYFVARHDETNTNYIIKTKRNMHDFVDTFPAKDLNILNTLINVNNPYILHYIRNENGQLLLNNKPPRSVPYLVFENAQNFSLEDYIGQGKLPERHAKLLFKKIINGIQAIHNVNICHRNISLYNIFLDENYNPKIFDFEYSCLNADNLKEIIGDKNYIAPEISAKHYYNGFKVDIFSLGQLLFNLVTGLSGFKSSNENDPYYKFIIRKMVYDYWHKVSLNINFNLSDNFKELYIGMVAYKPEERPTINEILNSSWLQEVNNLNPQQIHDLENEIREELLNREASIIQEKAKLKFMDEYL